MFALRDTQPPLKFNLTQARCVYALPEFGGVSALAIPAIRDRQKLFRMCAGLDSRCPFISLWDSYAPSGAIREQIRCVSIGTTDWQGKMPHWPNT